MSPDIQLNAHISNGTVYNPLYELVNGGLLEPDSDPQGERGSDTTKSFLDEMTARNNIFVEMNLNGLTPTDYFTPEQPAVEIEVNPAA